MFSVPEDLHLLLRKAVLLGSDIFPVPRNANYSNGVTKNTRVVCTYLKEYILNQAVDVNAKDDKLIIQEGSKIDTMESNLESGN